MHAHTHLYKSILHRQGSGVKAYVYVCVFMCVQVQVSLHVSYSANEVI